MDVVEGQVAVFGLSEGEGSEEVKVGGEVVVG
jgi:hypothetical protein